MTALADDEVEMETVAGHMYELRYPLSDGSGHVTVATTRPETMLGDTAVALNPADPARRGTSRQECHPADRRARDPDRRGRLRDHARRRRRPQGRIRHGLPEGHSRPRPQRLGPRPAARPGRHQRHGPRREHLGSTRLGRCRRRLRTVHRTVPGGRTRVDRAVVQERGPAGAPSATTSTPSDTVIDLTSPSSPTSATSGTSG